MKAPPFLIFPWQRPFLADIKNMLVSESRDTGSPAVLIVPNNRPWRYLLHLFAVDRQARILPKVIPLQDMVTEWWAFLGKRASRSLNTLDSVSLLHECVKKVSATDHRLAGQFAQMDMAQFLPWGIRLAGLLDEMMRHGVGARDLHYLDAEVAPPAAALLGALGHIYDAYLHELHACNYSTSGLEYLEVSRELDRIPPFLQPDANRHVYIAGFSILDDVEEKMLHALWQAGARICLHTDPALAHGERLHWACQPHKDWMQRWKARAETPPFPEGWEKNCPRTSFSFFSGYDCHSQLAHLRDTLTNLPGESASTAVILADSALLMPVLHHLPTKDINISMGYPLNRSPFVQFLKELSRLQANQTDDGKYYWRDLLRVVRHPCLRMLHVTGEDGQQIPLRDTLRSIEHHIQTGERLVLPSALLTVSASSDDPCAALLRQCLAVMLDDMAAAKTLAALADCLEGICNLLLRHGGDMWRNFPLDAEVLHRFMHTLIPDLRFTLLAKLPLSRSILLEILDTVLEREHIPFEAAPLTGLQILGILESRLLHFKNIFVMDATDDNLPGRQAQDPLFPDSLRHVLGLPDDRRRELAMAYNLYRLFAGAENVHFYWQEGIVRSLLFDGKKSRSRFVEQLIWEEEQRRNALLRPGDGPLKAARCDLRPMFAEEKHLPRTEHIAASLQNFLRKPIGATVLDSYLKCPLSFALQHLLRLEAVDAVTEGDDPPAVGNCIHAALQKLYEPYLHRRVTKGDITWNDVQMCLDAAMKNGEILRLPADSYLMLEVTATRRIWKYVTEQPDTEILALEEPCERSFPLGDVPPATIKGKLDRLDRREGMLHVIDYKTGHLHLPDTNLWTDASLFREVGELLSCKKPPPRADLDALYGQLRDRLRSVQLPAYIALLQNNPAGAVGNACLIDLKDSGKEKPLFPDIAGEDLENALRYCDLAISLVLHHLTTTEDFAARPDETCRWCTYRQFCSS